MSAGAVWRHADKLTLSPRRGQVFPQQRLEPPARRRASEEERTASEDDRPTIAAGCCCATSSARVSARTLPHGAGSNGLRHPHPLTAPQVVRGAPMATPSSTSTTPTCARMPWPHWMPCCRSSRSAQRVSRIRVVGHTDSIGTDAYNQALSERRAASAKVPARHGIPVGEIDAAGEGSAIPLPERHAGKPAEEPARRCRIPHCGRNHRAGAATTGASADGGMGEGDCGRPAAWIARPA